MKYDGLSHNTKCMYMCGWASEYAVAQQKKQQRQQALAENVKKKKQHCSLAAKFI